MTSVKTLREPARDIPVVAEVDVAVAGGGAAGIGAALGAAKAGASVALVEQFGCLGGNATAGMVLMSGALPDFLYGVGKELCKRLEQRDAYTTFRPASAFMEPEAVKQETVAMLTEHQVDFRLYCKSVAPIVENGIIKGLIFEGKGGRQAILAKNVIDATGDADVAFACGAPCQRGRESDEKMRPISLSFRLGNIDWERFAEYRDLNFDDFPYGLAYNTLDLQAGIIKVHGLQKTSEKAQQRGELDPNLHYIRMEGGSIKAGTAVFNNTRIYDVDGTRPEDLTKATVESYRQINQIIDVLQKYAPGFENCELIDTAPALGVRETRKIIGDSVITDGDFAKRHAYPDTVATIYKYGTENLEQHSPEGGEGHLDSYNNRREYYSKFDIPYRILVPKKVKNLLVAGRCVSVDHLGDTWTRGWMICVTLGQIAGASSALAAHGGAAVDEADIDILREELRRQGVRFELEDR